MLENRHGLRRSGDRNAVESEISRTSPDRLWGPPSLLYKGYRVTKEWQWPPNTICAHVQCTVLACASWYV